MVSVLWISLIISLGLGALSFFLRYVFPQMRRKIAIIGAVVSAMIAGFGIYEALTPPLLLYLLRVQRLFC